MIPGDGITMPIRPELRPLYPPHWRELSSHVRFERAGGRCQRCSRPHLALLRCLPDGRWFDEQAATWRDRRGRMARWPDLVEATQFRMTRVVLAAAHLDSDPTNNRLTNLLTYAVLNGDAVVLQETVTPPMAGQQQAVDE